MTNRTFRLLAVAGAVSMIALTGCVEPTEDMDPATPSSSAAPDSVPDPVMADPVVTPTPAEEPTAEPVTPEPTTPDPTAP